MSANFNVIDIDMRKKQLTEQVHAYVGQYLHLDKISDLDSFLFGPSTLTDINRFQKQELSDAEQQGLIEALRALQFLNNYSFESDYTTLDWDIEANIEIMILSLQSYFEGLKLVPKIQDLFQSFFKRTLTKTEGSSDIYIGLIEPWKRRFFDPGYMYTKFIFDSYTKSRKTIINDEITLKNVNLDNYKKILQEQLTDTTSPIEHLLIITAVWDCLKNTVIDRDTLEKDFLETLSTLGHKGIIAASYWIVTAELNDIPLLNDQGLNPAYASFQPNDLIFHLINSASQIDGYPDRKIKFLQNVITFYGENDEIMQQLFKEIEEKALDYNTDAPHFYSQIINHSLTENTSLFNTNRCIKILTMLKHFAASKHTTKKLKDNDINEQVRFIREGYKIAPTQQEKDIFLADVINLGLGSLLVGNFKPEQITYAKSLAYYHYERKLTYDEAIILSNPVNSRLVHFMRCINVPGNSFSPELVHDVILKVLTHMVEGVTPKGNAIDNVLTELDSQTEHVNKTGFFSVVPAKESGEAQQIPQNIDNFKH